MKTNILYKLRLRLIVCIDGQRQIDGPIFCIADKLTEADILYGQSKTDILYRKLFFKHYFANNKIMLLKFDALY